MCVILGVLGIILGVVCKLQIELVVILGVVGVLLGVVGIILGVLEIMY